MQVLATAIPEVKIIVPRVFRDERGFFMETYNQSALRDHAGIPDAFVQDNQSCSVHSGVVRGLHFQLPPYAQGKLIRVLRGAILDVAVDVRHGSPTFGQSVEMRLDAEGGAQAWVPVGFAHGFCTLEPQTEVFYKGTQPYDPASERGLAWDDPDLGIAWPISSDDAILSEKDRRNPRLKDLPVCFRYCQDDPSGAT